MSDLTQESADGAAENAATGVPRGSSVPGGSSASDDSVDSVETPRPGGESAPAGESEQPDAPGGGRRAGRAAELEHEGEVAADYLEGLLDIVDLDGDLDLDVEGDRAVVAIVGSDELDKLVGRNGVALEALQELTRLAVVTATGNHSRLMLDIAGFRAARRRTVTEQGQAAATAVRESGEPQRLPAMPPFERKVVHDALAAVAGIRTESEGEEPRRRVVVLPA